MNQSIDVLNRAADLWWPFVMHGAWQAALVGMVVLLVLSLGKRWPAPVRYGLVLLALVKFLVPPMASFPSGVLSQIQLSAGDGYEAGAPNQTSALGAPANPTDAGFVQPVATATLASPVDSDEVGMRQRIEQAAAESASTASSAPNPSIETAANSQAARPENETLPSQTVVQHHDSLLASLRRIHVTTWLMLLHVCGAALFGFAAWRRTRLIRTIVARAASNNLAVTNRETDSFQRLARETLAVVSPRRTPQIVVSPDVQVPFSAGVLRPVVVLPRETVESFSEEELRAVLLHELVHHKRGDLWMTWLQFVVSLMWWFHPVMWLVNRAIRNIREDCCDDLLLSRAFVPAADYCQTILKVAKGLRRSRSESQLLTASMADRHPLAERITRIMDARIPRTDRLGIAGIAVVVFAGCLILPGLGRAPASSVLADGTLPVDETPEPETGETVSIRGRLIDESGKPVDSAKVWLNVDERWADSSFEGAPVVADCQSTADGKFELTPLKSKVDRFVKSSTTKFRIWAHKTGLPLARHVTSGRLPDQPFEIRIPAGEPTEFQIRNPDGTPCAAAEVTVPTARFADDSYVAIPEVIRNLSATRTDSEGRVRIDSIAHEAILSLEFVKAGIGRQQFLYHAEGQRMPTELTLREVGAVEGRLVLPAGEQADLSTVKLRVATLEKTNRGGDSYWASHSILQPDSDGRFHIPEIAEGTLRVFTFEPDTFAFRSVPPDGVIVTPGETSQLEIPVQKAVKVARLIRDEKTKQPIAGVRVHMQSGHQHINARTNAAGRFTAMILPETRYHTVYNVPDAYIHRQISDQQVTQAPAGAELHELEPIEMLRGRTIEGTVVDASGNPFGDVQVGANWRDPSEDTGHMVMNSVNARQWGKSNSKGRFRIAAIHPDVDVTLVPVRAGVRIGPEKTIAAVNSEPVRLETDAHDFVSLDGRVLDQEGKPIVGAQVRILVATTQEEIKEDEWRYATLEQTDAEGRIKTAAHLPRQFQYRMSVRPRGKEVAASPWLSPQKDGTTFADLAVDREKVEPQEANVASAAAQQPNLERALVDSTGAPVAGARVIAWHDAARVMRRSGSDGKFVFRDVPATGAWVFAKADGFRFHGEFARPDAVAKAIVLTNADKSAPRKLQPAAAETASEDVMKQARAELARFFEIALNTTGDWDVENRKTDLHQLLAVIDPEAALKLIGDKRFDFSKINFHSSDGISHADWHANAIRANCAFALARTDLERALEIVATIPRPGYRAQALVRVAANCPEKDRRRLLEQSAELVDEIEQVTSRIEHLTALGAQFHALGDDDRARALFKQALADLPNLADEERAAFTRGYLAWQMAPLDREASMGLLPVPRAASDNDHDRYYSNVAHQIAAIDPAEAERLLGKSKSDNKAARVCYRMAKVDLPRAERIARSAARDARMSAYALGMIALAAENAPAEHRLALVDEAYDILEQQVGVSDTRIYTSMTVAVGLLPVVEQVAPDRLDEFFWRALSMRTGITLGNESRALGRHGPGNAMRLADPVLGACLARYDRKTAQLLTMTPGDETLDMGYFDAPYFLLGSLAILDPQTAVNTVARMPTGENREQKAACEAWKQVVPMLGRSTTERWDWLMEHHYGLWRPDNVDF